MAAWRRVVTALCLFTMCVAASAQPAGQMKLARELVSFTGGTGGVAPFLFATLAAGGESQQVSQLASSRRIGTPPKKSDDIVFENGEFLQQPSFE